MGQSGGSIVVASVGRQLLSATDAETAPSFLWFAAIQCIESKQNLAGLAPQGCFISAEAVQGEVGQISETQKATSEVGSRINGFRTRAGPGLRFGCDAVRCPIGIDIDRI